MFRDHKMITELIETSRKASRVQVDSNQAASRLENCPKPESKRLAACPQAASRLVTGWEIVFASSSSFVNFLHLFSPSLKTVNNPSIFTSNFFLFHPFSCPNQPFKLIPMHFIFIKHFSIMISSLVFHHFIIVSHA